MTFKKFTLGFFIGWMICGLSALGQVSGFTHKNPICILENVQMTNTSLGAASFQWDFCNGDLDTIAAPVAVKKTLIGDFPIDIQIEYDAGNWYGFTVDFLTSKMYRLEYGASLTQMPTLIELGDMGVLYFPTQSRFYKENGVWIGFVTNYVGNGLVRLTFGNGLGNVPTVKENMGAFSSLQTPISLEILDSTGDYTIIVSNSSVNKISMIHFGSSLLNNPTNTDVIETGGAVGFDGVGRISIKKYNGNWYGIINSVNDSKVYRMQLGNVVFDAVVTYDLIGSITNPEGVELVKEGEKYYGLVASRSGGIFKIDFLSNIEGTSTISSVGKFGVTDEFRSLELVRDSPGWRLFSLSRNGAVLSRIDLNDRCSGTALEASSLFEPSVYYEKAGQYTIDLTSFSASGNRSVTSSSITVQNLIAPSLDLNTSSICVNNAGTFEVPNSSNLVSYSWDFNNDGTEDSDQANPTYIFNVPGQYPVSVRATDSFGCSNDYIESIKIYSIPVSAFTPPSGLICTNNEFTFTNNTIDNFDGNLSYQWLVDNSPESTSRDIKYTFTSQGDKVIKLIASIPGCSDEETQTVLNVQSGPAAGFTTLGKCEDSSITFTNTSSGSIAGYAWSFGNGQTSINTNETQVYPDKGDYLVSLETKGTNGCISTTSKNLTIYSSPQANFSLDLPPFSCSGTPSQFNDLTPNPTDSNLASWLWSFNDPVAGSSTDKNPLYTFAAAGDYNVSLTATTNFGCSSSVQKVVTIAASPSVNFTSTPACSNQGTRFTDASGAGIKSWLWTIGNSTYSFNNPTHVFISSGNYNVKLTVTGTNDCVATIIKPVNVPVRATVDFTSANACEGQLTTFNDASIDNIDPAASWSWDFAGQGTASGNAAQYSFAKAGSYAVKLTSTQKSGCVYSLTKNVTINTTPVAAFTSSPEWGVPPLSVQFTNSSTGASSYSWNFNDKNNSTTTLASPNFQFTDLGDYVVDLTATSALGCSNSISGKISVIIPSLDLELKQLQLVKDPASNAYRIFVTVKNKSNYLLTSVDVVVDISGNALIKETINTILAPNAEIVQLLNNQILPHGNLLTYLCASIEMDNDNDPFNNSKCEPVEEETVVFDPYPNPSNGTFRFQWIAPATDNAHFEIFNSIGQLAFEQYAEAVQVGLNQVQFNLSNLNTGAYYFRFSSNSTSKTLPIQIVR